MLLSSIKRFRSGELKGGRCKNLNDSSNSGNSSGDESSDGIGDPTLIRGSDLHSTSSHLSSLFKPTSDLHLNPTITSSTSSSSVPPNHHPMYHPSFKFGLSSFGHPSSGHHQSPFADAPNLVSMHPAATHPHHHSPSSAAEVAMLQIHSAVAAGVDYSSALGSHPSHHQNPSSLWW